MSSSRSSDRDSGRGRIGVTIEAGAAIGVWVWVAIVYGAMYAVGVMVMHAWFGSRLASR